MPFSVLPWPDLAARSPLRGPCAGPGRGAAAGVRAASGHRFGGRCAGLSRSRGCGTAVPDRPRRGAHYWLTEVRGRQVPVPVASAGAGGGGRRWPRRAVVSHERWSQVRPHVLPGRRGVMADSAMRLPHAANASMPLRRGFRGRRDIGVEYDGWRGVLLLGPTFSLVGSWAKALATATLVGATFPVGGIVSLSSFFIQG
jgi:hypothetical protein